jgi:LacI family transcriptional regulator
MPMALTLEQIAKLAGVSRSTVSRVVNDYSGVRIEVRERVSQVIRETGYQPHAAARSLVTRRSQIIGVVIPEAVTTLFTDPFFPLLLAGVTETCNAHRYHLMLSLFDRPAGQEEMYRHVLGSGYLDGVIVASFRVGEPLIPELLERQVPFVIVGRHPDRRVNYVDADNIGGARMAVEHLIRLGHRRIGIITGPVDMPGSQDRLQGYQQALDAHRIPVEQALIAEGDFTESSGATCAQRLFPALPTAMFVANDTMAAGALRALRRAGRRVPQDMALIGYDDVPIAAAVEPALTTVRQPITRLGSMAAEVLLGMLNSPNGTDGPPHKVILPTELVVRYSCGALA